MFLFIGGIGPRTITLDKQARICPSCGRLTLYLKRIDQYVSLFFIPIFPVKRGEPFLSCEGCGASFNEQGGPRFRDERSTEQTYQHSNRILIFSQIVYQIIIVFYQ